MCTDSERPIFDTFSAVSSLFIKTNRWKRWCQHILTGEQWKSKLSLVKYRIHAKTYLGLYHIFKKFSKVSPRNNLTYFIRFLRNFESQRGHEVSYKKKSVIICFPKWIKEKITYLSLFFICFIWRSYNRLFFEGMSLISSCTAPFFAFGSEQGFISYRINHLRSMKFIWIMPSVPG